MAGLLKSVNKLLQPNLLGALLSGCQRGLICRVPVSYPTFWQLQVEAIVMPLTSELLQLVSQVVSDQGHVYTSSVSKQTQEGLPWGQGRACCVGLPLVRRFPARRVSPCSQMRRKQWGREAWAAGEVAGAWAWGADRNPAPLHVTALGNSARQGSFAGGSLAACGKDRRGELLTPPWSAKQRLWRLSASPAGLKHKFL